MENRDTSKSDRVNRILGRLKRGNENFSPCGSLKKKNNSNIRIVDEQAKKVDKDILQNTMEHSSNAGKQVSASLTLASEYSLSFIADEIGTFSQCRVDHDKDNNTIVLIGNQHEVSARKIKIQQILQNVHELYIELTDAQNAILRSEDGREWLGRFLGDQLEWHLNDTSLVVVGTNYADVNKGCTDLQNRFNGKVSLPVSEGFSGEIYTEIHRLEEEEDLLVKIHFDGRLVTIEGVKDDVAFAKREMSNFLEENTLQLSEESVSINGNVAKFIERHLITEFNLLFCDVKSKSHTQPDGFTINLEGIRDKVEHAVREVSAFLSQICSNEPIVLSSNADKQFLIRKGLENPSVKQRINTFEDDRQCLVDVNIVQSNNASKASSMTNSLVKNMSHSCKVLLKRDKDVTNENSHILVCPIMENVRQKTAVLHRFDTVCSGIMDELMAEYKRSNGANILKTCRNMTGLKSNCKAVVYIMLKRWNNLHRKESVAYFEQQVIHALQQAASLGASSISFPVIGYGRAFQFPADEAAKAALNAVQKFLSNAKYQATLTEIVFLAPEQDLFAEFQKHLDSSNQDVTSISITSLKRASSQIQSDLNILLEESCCGIDKISLDNLEDLPEPSFLKDLANELGLLVDKNVISNDNIEYSIAGVKENRAIMHERLQKYFSEVSEGFPKRPIRSISEARGSLKFLKCAGESDEEFPSYWSLHCVDYFLGKIDKPATYLKIEVGKRTSTAISTLISNLWTGNKIGHGNDAKNLKHHNIKVKKVERLENYQLFEKYRINRKHMINRMYKDNQMAPDISGIKSKVENNMQSSGGVATTPHLDGFMKTELLHKEINEHFLFHGCKESTLGDIIDQGFDPRVASESGMFGKAVYFAENPTKSDQYADVRDARTPLGTPLTMILCRVLIGHPFLCGKKHAGDRNSTKMVRPPCKQCLKDRCGCPKKQLFDSVLGQGWLFREFVVYDTAACYPEFIITYVRE